MKAFEKFIDKNTGQIMVGWWGLVVNNNHDAAEAMRLIGTAICNRIENVGLTEDREKVLDEIHKAFEELKSIQP